MKKLIAADYIEQAKYGGTGRPQTLYRLTAKGREAFDEYLESLKRLLPLG